MTPTTELFLYQPVTSVSRVDRESAERILSRAFSLLSDTQTVPHIQEHQQEWLSRALCALSLERNHPVKSFLIQNAAFLNRQNVVPKEYPDLLYRLSAVHSRLPLLVLLPFSGAGTNDLP